MALLNKCRKFAVFKESPLLQTARSQDSLGIPHCSKTFPLSGVCLWYSLLANQCSWYCFHQAPLLLSQECQGVRGRALNTCGPARQWSEGVTHSKTRSLTFWHWKACLRLFLLECHTRNTIEHWRGLIYSQLHPNIPTNRQYCWCLVHLAQPLLTSYHSWRYSQQLLLVWIFSTLASVWFPQGPLFFNVYNNDSSRASAPAPSP